MKNKIQLLLLILIIGIGCQDSKLTTIYDSSKLFEDQLLKGELSDIEIEGNILKADLTLKNKTNQSTSIQLKDFVFTTKNNQGRIVQKNNLLKTGPWRIPNYDNLMEDEKIMARKEKMNENLRNFTIQSSFWSSEISLDANETATRKIEIKFKNKIELEELEFYFNGEHKRLLKI